MELKVAHTTRLEYGGSAAASYNEARMTPQTGPGQLVVHHRLEVNPSPWQWGYRDYWGTHVTAFEVLDAHESLSVTASATVHTAPAPEAEPSLTWAALREAAVADRFTEYLAIRDRVRPPADLMSLVDEVASSTSRPGTAAREICRLVHDEVQYVVGSTQVSGRAADSWEARAGVCQDMAHLVLGGLRSLGIPARYVSGYLHPSTSPEVGVPVAGESHAWVEWWDAGWHGFDPTNDTAPGERHVVVARGRNYDDVRPLSGIYTGAATSSMSVAVEVTRLA